MGFISSLFGGNIIESVGKVADELTTSDEERLEKASRFQY